MSSPADHFNARELPPNFHQDKFGLLLNLELGPHEGDGNWTEAQLRRGWMAYKAEVMDRPTYVRRPDRAWGWWAFEANEDMPDSYAARVLRLLELGELTDDEIVTVGRVAHESLKAIERAKYLEDSGSVVTVPSNAVRNLFAWRERDRAAWERVLVALPQP